MNLNEVKMKNRYNVAVRRAVKGDITGLDLKAIVEYQMKEYIGEGEEPLNDYELAMVTMHMVHFN